MAWPAPASVQQPSISLPWQSPQPRILEPVPWRNHGQQSWQRRGPSRNRTESLRKAKYGVGMLAGLLGVHAIKGLINLIPVVNLVTKPILDLFPTIVVGPALGAAVVYGMEKGDPLAAAHLVRDKVARASEEVGVVVRDLAAELEARGERLQRQVAPQMEATARAATRAVEEMERTVVPAMEREYRAIEAQSRRLLEQQEQRR